MIIEWQKESPRTHYGYAPATDCAGPTGRKVAVASITEVRDVWGEDYYWSVFGGRGSNCPTREEAEREAEAAYQHAQGLLGSVRT